MTSLGPRCPPHPHPCPEQYVPQAAASADLLPGPMPLARLWLLLVMFSLIVKKHNVFSLFVPVALIIETCMPICATFRKPTLGGSQATCSAMATVQKSGRKPSSGWMPASCPEKNELWVRETSGGLERTGGRKGSIRRRDLWEGQECAGRPRRVRQADSGPWTRGPCM